MIKISTIRGREILDSRGNPTVEADVTLDVRAYRRVHQRARAKPWSCVMATSLVTLAKAFKMRSPTSIPRCGTR